MPARPSPGITLHRATCTRVLALVVAAAALGCKSPPPPTVTATRVVAPPPRPPPPSPLSGAEGAAAAAANPAQLTPGFVRIAAGQRVLGSAVTEADRSDDELSHVVTISRDFEMAATEVTVEDYRTLVGSSPAAHQGCDRCPVEQVSWFEAARFCALLSRHRHLQPCTTISEQRVDFAGLDCPGFRLPTEAEWEAAARGGVAGPRVGDIDTLAYFDTNSGLQSHPVGSKAPNAYGLFDMFGNVAEWVWDWQGDYAAEPSVDPLGPAQGSNRVFRGGAYRWPSNEARAAFRNGYGPLNKVEFIGFRCVRTLPR